MTTSRPKREREPVPAAAGRSRSRSSSTSCCRWRSCYCCGCAGTPWRAAPPHRRRRRLGGSPGVARGDRPDVRLLRDRDAGLPARGRGAARPGDAVGQGPRPSSGGRSPCWAWPGSCLVGCALVDVTPSTRGLLATAASVAVIGGLYAAPAGPAARALALPLPRYLGQISYGTYLWHWPVILVARQLFDVGPLVLWRSPRRSRPDWRRCPTRCSSGRSAAPSAARPVPLARGGGRARRERACRDAGAAAGAALDRAAGRGQPRGRRPVRRRRPGGLGGRPRACRPRPGRRTGRRTGCRSPCTPGDLEACVRVTGDGPRVLLVGDSQAAMFVTAFESLAASTTSPS